VRGARRLDPGAAPGRADADRRRDGQHRAHGDPRRRRGGVPLRPRRDDDQRAGGDDRRYPDHRSSATARAHRARRPQALHGAARHANYNRILLSPVLAGEMTIKDIMLNDVDWYEKNGVTLHLNKKVAKIDRRTRKVVAADGTQAGYDRLLLATGSNPFVLPIPGAKLEGVLTYRDIGDTNAMVEAAAKYEHAVVIGGGLLGLEAANGLKTRGMN